LRDRLRRPTAIETLESVGETTHAPPCYKARQIRPFHETSQNYTLNSSLADQGTRRNSPEIATVAPIPPPCNHSTAVHQPRLSLPHRAQARLTCPAKHSQPPTHPTCAGSNMHTKVLSPESPSPTSAPQTLPIGRGHAPMCPPRTPHSEPYRRFPTRHSPWRSSSNHGRPDSRSANDMLAIRTISPRPLPPATLKRYLALQQMRLFLVFIFFAVDSAPLLTTSDVVCVPVCYHNALVSWCETVLWERRGITRKAQ
jgi:hypothetical protein